MARFMQICKMIAFTGVLFSGSCLADNFWSTLLGDTIIAGATSVVVDTVVNGALGN